MMIQIRLNQFLTISLILLLVNSCGPSQEEKDKIAEENHQVELQELQLQLIEQARLDTLAIYTASAEEEFKNKRIPSAILYLDTALTFALKSEINKIVSTRASYSFEIKKYKDAIADYSSLINAGVNKKDNYYERALCYEKLKKRQEAVNDLKEAIVLNNSEAEKLHDKINPIRKRVAYYVTRCCDGTTSNATGRGACSHHGGVCNWNEPVYEEYRKY